jgi:hypothetical protein
MPKSLWLVQGATHDGIRSPVLDELAPDVIAFLDSALVERVEQVANPQPAPPERTDKGRINLQ